MPVLSALLAPELLLKDGQLSINLSNTYLLAAIPSFAAGFFSKSIFLTVVAGMAAIVLSNNVLLDVRLLGHYSGGRPSAIA